MKGVRRLTVSVTTVPASNGRRAVAAATRRPARANVTADRHVSPASSHPAVAGLRHLAPPDSSIPPSRSVPARNAASRATVIWSAA